MKREEIDLNPGLSPEDTALFAVIAGGVNRAAVRSAYERTKSTKPDIVGDGIYDHLALFDQMATDEAVAAHETLFMKNLGLARYVARLYKGLCNRLTIDDLDQEASLALALGLWQHDPARGTMPSTSIFPRIQNRLLHTIAANDFVVRLPVDMVGTLNSMRRHNAGDLHAATLGDMNAQERIADKTNGRSVRSIVRVESIFRHSVSIDEAFGRTTDYFDNEGMPTIRQIRSDQSDSLPTTTHDDMIEEVEHEVDSAKFVSQALSMLDDRSRAIIELRCGLRDGVPYTFRQVAIEFGISPERVRQIELKALSKIRMASYYGEEQAFDESSLSSNPVVPETTYETLRREQAKLHAWGVIENGTLPQNSIVGKIAPRVLARLLHAPATAIASTKTMTTILEDKPLTVQEVPDVRIPAVREYVLEMLEDLSELEWREWDSYYVRQDKVKMHLRDLVAHELSNPTRRLRAGSATEIAALPATRSFEALKELQPLYHALGDFEERLYRDEMVPFANTLLRDALIALFDYDTWPSAETAQAEPPDMREPENQALVLSWINKALKRTD